MCDEGKLVPFSKNGAVVLNQFVIELHPEKIQETLAEVQTDCTPFVQSIQQVLLVHYRKMKGVLLLLVIMLGVVISDTMAQETRSSI